MYILLRHAARYVVGYAVGIFLLIAAITCGAMRSAAISMTMQISLWNVVRMILTETVLLVGLIIASTHPFGCALSAAALVGKGYQAGLAYGWWKMQAIEHPLWLLPLGLQGIISIGAVLVACCMTAYTALRVQALTKREYYRSIIYVWIVQVICVILRCVICLQVM